MKRLIVEEEDFPELEIEIDKEWTKGRNVCGLFLKKEDFEKIVQELSRNDRYSNLLKYHKNVIDLSRGSVRVRKSDVIEKVKENDNLPVVKIRAWHKIKWSLRKNKLDRMEIATIGRWSKLTGGFVISVAFLAGP